MDDEGRDGVRTKAGVTAFGSKVGRDSEVEVLGGFVTSIVETERKYEVGQCG